MNKIINIDTDIVIVGSGIAGLYSALNIPEKYSITIVTKKALEDSNSALAQGGICVSKGEYDIKPYIEDTLKAGKYENDIDAVTALVNESKENVDKLIEYGVDFDKQHGELCYTKEAAHSTNRILHVKDETGRYIMESLCEKIKLRKNTFILENTLCSDIIENNNSCHGIIALNNNIQYNIHSQFVIMATGGIGGLFKNSTNRRHITGDGLSICKKHNIKLKNLNYVQFHPTALYIKGSSDRRFLISESVRGEGALIKNKQGERFIDELLPRDVVANAIYNELNSSGEECVYLDLSTMKPEYIKNRFPYIYKECLSHGIDITKEYIPIHPVQHYFMGGIDVDLNSESSMKKLYAVGECSCTGVHGANRLASNSLLEGLVFSKRAVNDILSKFKENQAPYEATNIKASSMRLAEAELFDTAINLFKDMIGEKKNELVNC